MKISDKCVLRQFAGAWIVLPVAEKTVDFNGMLTLNESGVLLWRKLEDGCTKAELIEALLSEYEVTRDEAEADVYSFISKLENAGCIE